MLNKKLSEQCSKNYDGKNLQLIFRAFGLYRVTVKFYLYISDDTRHENVQVKITTKLLCLEMKLCYTTAGLTHR